MSELATLGLFLALFIAGSSWARSSEVREWNGGICRETGEPWVLFDIDSQGGRGYVTRVGERHTTWVSWPGVDQNYRPTPVKEPSE